MSILGNPLVIVWAILAAIVLALLAYRAKLTAHEDTDMHFDVAESSLASRQKTAAHRIELVDTWGKVLTVVVLVYGLALAGAYLYSIWQRTANGL